MRYISTRGGTATGLPFCDVLLEGLAPDGGLYVPETYPQVDAATLEEWRALLADEGYAAVAHRVLELFIDDIPSDDLLAITQRAYNDTVFSDPEITPVTQLRPGTWLLHLSEGPTAAFKDMAMQLLGQLFEYELARRGARITILGATSGDTGSAAEYAMLGRVGIDVFMLTPAGRMTPFQQAQMFSLDDPHIHNIAVEGVFDDCQDIVKAVNADADFKARHSLGAVNSINVGRLLAQVIYYVVGWLKVTNSAGQVVDFCVPTGNFGNICAGHFARCMGVPIRRLVLATNENNVLDEFFRTGVYRVRGSAETWETSSPSMDISKASNFERFVFDLLGRDAERVRGLFERELPASGEFDLSGTPEFATQHEAYGFVSSSSTHADRLATIERVWGESQVTIDPHTADGVKVALELAEVGVPIIVTETALPVKFSATILEALGVEPARPAAFVGLEDLPRHVIDLPNDVEAVKALIDRLA
ncbi:MAG TPA: threonine synthase [Propionibacteriaceae bacterium]|nr:threonine synthase [Propionibacteriaceae bacterium]